MLPLKRLKGRKLVIKRVKRRIRKRTTRKRRRDKSSWSKKES